MNPYLLLKDRVDERYEAVKQARKLVRIKEKSQKEELVNFEKELGIPFLMDEIFKFKESCDHTDSDGKSTIREERCDICDNYID